MPDDPSSPADWPPDWTPRARPDVVFRRVGEDWVLFDPVAQDIHVLNLAAALVWSFCDGAHPVATIHRRVEEAWDGVEEPGVAASLRAFADRGLLVAPDAGAVAPGDG